MKFIFAFFAKIFWFCVAVLTAMGAGLALYAISLLPNLPTVEEIREIPLNIPLRIYSSDEKLIAEYGNERRIPVTLDQAPPLLIDAILVTEDDNFYHHTGVDFPGIVRALISNIRSQSRGQGASTVTMQVVRNFFLDPEKTYTRKLKEILLAFNMERALTKDEILELYLNKIFLGHRSYGFAAAAQVYYGQKLIDLSLPEIAMLAGLPKAPSRDNPISNPNRASERRDHVLNRLFELNKIDKLSMETAKQAPITAERHIAEVDLQAPYVAEMARQILVDQVGTQVYERGLNVTLTMNSKYQEKAHQTLRQGLLDYDVRHGYRGALKNVDVSNLDEKEIDELLYDYPPSQKLVPGMVLSVSDKGFEARTRNGQNVSVEMEGIKWARAYKTPNSQGPEPTKPSSVVKSGDIVYLIPNEEGNWRLSQMPAVSGALVSIDSKTGAILALTGGFDYYLSKFNRAIQAERQPGSNIKPFIYSAAMDNGFSPGTPVSGAPIVIENDLEGIWRPENYSKKFFGPTRLRKALSLSLNLVSVRLLRAIGINKTINHLEKFGFDPEKLPNSLSLSLGSTAITPIELASGYSVLSNGGKRATPYFIEKIEDGDGNPISLEDLRRGNCDGEDCDETANESKSDLETESSQDTGISTSQEITGFASPNPARQVISPQNAFLTTSIMKQVILSGTGRKALKIGRQDLAGKTGTTNNYKDAWFSGFSPDVTTTVFVGFDEPAHLGRRESGGSAALPIWVDFMDSILKDYPERPVRVPDDIITRFIDRDTGELTQTGDPNGYSEYFLKGTEPQNNVRPLVRTTTPSGQDAGSSGAGTNSESEALF